MGALDLLEDPEHGGCAPDRMRALALGKAFLIRESASSHPLDAAL
jgi:hypothetical protein